MAKKQNKQTNKQKTKTKKEDEEIKRQADTELKLFCPDCALREGHIRQVLHYRFHWHKLEKAALAIRSGHQCRREEKRTD